MAASSVGADRRRLRQSPPLVCQPDNRLVGGDHPADKPKSPGRKAWKPSIYLRSRFAGSGTFLRARRSAQLWEMATNIFPSSSEPKRCGSRTGGCGWRLGPGSRKQYHSGSNWPPFEASLFDPFRQLRLDHCSSRPSFFPSPVTITGHHWRLRDNERAPV